MSGYSNLVWFRSENAAGFFSGGVFLSGFRGFFRSFSLSLFFSSSFVLAAGLGVLSSSSVRPAAGRHRTSAISTGGSSIHVSMSSLSLSARVGRLPSLLPPSSLSLSLSLLSQHA